MATLLLKTIMELLYSIISHEHFLYDTFPSLEYLNHYLGIN